MHLYELSDGIRAVQEAMENEDGDLTGDPEAWQQALSDLEEAFDKKAIGIALLMEEWESEAARVQIEATRLSSRAAAIKNRHARLKHYLQAEMEEAGIDKIKGDLVSINVQNSPPFVEANMEALPSNFVRTTLVMPKMDVPETLLPFVKNEEPDKVALKELLQAGSTVPGASLHQGQHLRVR